MKALLDTHAFLWWVTDDRRLPPQVRRIMADESNEIFFSVVSAWEIVVKAATGRIALPHPAERFMRRQVAANDFRVLSISLEHALRVGGLPPLHTDPFDRLLVAQALVERLIVLSGDRQVAAYPVDVRWSS